MNGLKVALLMIGLMALFMWVGYLLGGRNGMILAFALATVMNFVSYWFSDRIVLGMYRARRISETDHPRLYRIVREVATVHALMPMPAVYVVPSKAPNAFATGRNAEHSAVAATEGLLELLNDDELKGVIGHEIAHIQNRDMLIGTIAATLAGAIGILASIARWGAIFGGYSRDSNRGGGIGLLIAAIVAPLAAMVIQMAISRQREYKADEQSGRLTGKYLPLASALEKLHKAPVRFNLDQRPATAHLMIANPLSGRGLSSLFSTHPPVSKRIERLHRLSQDTAYQGYGA
ncbi:MAG: zinc metalloprotease HtpX [Candidatus Zixiibacteriota bacterium]|nr:MAG: zinc metalloprotease HtpX [candidate division Zixibacteria bacterium]